MASQLKGLRYAERPDGFFDVRLLPTDRLERLSAQQLAARIENEQPTVIEGFVAGFLLPLAGPPPALIGALSARGLQLVEDARSCPRCSRPCPRCGRT